MKTRISKLFRAYAENQGISVSECEFYFGDQKIKDYEASPVELGIGDYDIIIVLRHNNKNQRHWWSRNFVKDEEVISNDENVRGILSQNEYTSIEFGVYFEWREDWRRERNTSVLELESDDVINVRLIIPHIDWER